MRITMVFADGDNLSALRLQIWILLAYWSLILIARGVTIPSKLEMWVCE